jgi:branched-chain amino acid transport system permease protein
MDWAYYGTQFFNGLVQGGFYALLALGLSVIFGLLRVVNFAHGGMYMLGAFVAYYGGQFFGLPFLAALVLAPLLVGAFGVVLERLLLRRLYRLDPLYNLLLTFALVLVIEDVMRLFAGSLGSPYSAPDWLSGATNLGFTIYPTYRLFVVAVSLVVCFAVWFVTERTTLGARLRAATENPSIARALGLDVDLLITVTFGAGVGLAGLAGVLAAPNTNVVPDMGDAIIITTFAIVVIGGMGSILGSVITGFIIGVITAIGAVYYPPIATTLPFVLMAVVLLFRPAGLFGKSEGAK